MRVFGGRFDERGSPALTLLFAKVSVFMSGFCEAPRLKYPPSPTHRDSDTHNTMNSSYFDLRVCLIRDIDKRYIENIDENGAGAERRG